MMPAGAMGKQCMAATAGIDPMPAVTTVLPTYRRPLLLQRSARSAGSQEDVEVVLRICDNASKDSTSEVVAALADSCFRVDYVRREQNIGAIQNFVEGVRGIETPFFSLLADDDYLLPGFYRQAIEDLSRHPEAMFWVGTTLNVSPDGTVWDARLERWPRDGIYRGIEGVLAMTGGLAPNWTGILFRSGVLSAPGFIDQKAGGPADLDCTLRMAARFPFYVRRVPVAVSMLNPESFSATQPLEAFWPGWQRMLQNMAELEDLSPLERRQVGEALMRDARRMLFRRGINALVHGRSEFARDASTALRQFGGGGLRAAMLDLARLGSLVPGMRSVLAAVYGRLERRIVASRSGLQTRHGHLLLGAHAD